MRLFPIRPLTMTPSSKRVSDFTGGITDDIAGRFKQDPVMLG
jgi:hypothetical protein